MADISKLFDVIEDKARKAYRGTQIKLGTVNSVSGSQAQVVLDGDEGATPVAIFCSGVKPNVRCLVTVQNTQYYITGVRQ